MKSVEAHFTGNNRTYTYAVDPGLAIEVGQKYLTKTPSKGFTYVNILKVHKVSQLDPNAKFEYKELKSRISVTPTTIDGKPVYRASLHDYHAPFAGHGVSEEDAIAQLLKQLNS